MLTQRQHDLLLFIDGHIKATGTAPSFDELATHAGLKSKSGVSRLVDALVERGFLSRRRIRARALEVLRLPGEPDPASAREALRRLVRALDGTPQPPAVMLALDAAKAALARPCG